MKLSEIRDLLATPTQHKAEALVNALVARGALDRPSARLRVARFLRDREGIDTERSAWSMALVILTDGEFYRIASGECISLEEYEDHGFTCHNCDEVYHLDDEVSLGGYVDGSWCRPCANEELYYCRCDGVYQRDRCDDCDEYADSSGGARFVNYSANVTSLLRSFRHAPGEVLPPEPLYLGVELEVVPRSNSRLAKRVVYQTVRDFAVLKYDSSVPEGFEVVSVPATLAWHRQIWPAALEQIRKVAKSWAHPDCGMHVHFSRNALTPLQIGKVLVFINAPQNQAFVWRLAGRSPTHFAKVVERKVTDGRLNFYSEHHDAISLSHRNSSKSLEVRIFRGNVSEYGFLKNLDFVGALAEWTAKASINHLTSEAFISWMKQPWNRKSYPYLDGWLTHAGYYRVSTKPVQRAYDD